MSGKPKATRKLLRNGMRSFAVRICYRMVRFKCIYEGLDGV